jgi:uncharacterized protein (TIGR00251 family)
MNIKVKVHPSSSKEEIKKLNEGEFGVWVKEKPVENKVNIKLIKILERYFNKEVKIVSGFKSKNKVIEIK